MFELHKSGITDKEVEVMSYLLRMEKQQIYTIFLTWCQRYEVPNLMTRPDETIVPSLTTQDFTEKATGCIEMTDSVSSCSMTWRRRFSSCPNISALFRPNNRTSNGLTRSVSSPTLMRSVFQLQTSADNVKAQTDSDVLNSSSGINLVMDERGCVSFTTSC